MSNAHVSFTLDVPSATPTDDDVQNAPTPEHSPIQINFASVSADGNIRSTPALYMPNFPDTQNLAEGQEHEIGELKLLRRGLQVVHVFGSGNIRLQCLVELAAEPVEMTGSVHTGSISLSVNIFDKTFAKTYNYPLNTGIFSGSQIKKQGKRTVKVRETIQFTGQTERRVRFWFSNPSPTVLSSSTFVNAEGNTIRVPTTTPSPPPPPNQNPSTDNSVTSSSTSNDCPAPVSQPRNKTIQPNVHIRSTKVGTERSTFYASEACWGSLQVEYSVDCEEFVVLYDHGSPQQKAYIFKAEEGDPIGYTIDKGNNEYDHGMLPGMNYGSDSETTNPPKYLKRYKKAEVFAPDTDSFLVFAENGKRNASATFTATPKLVEIPRSELPRLAVYEYRKRTKVYPEGASSGTNYTEVDHKTMVCYLDPYGNVIEDNFAEPLVETDDGSN